MPFPSGTCLAEGAWLGVMTDGRQPLCGGNKGRAAGERAPHCAPARHHATPRYGAGYSDGGKRPMLPDRLSQFRKAKTFLQDINVKCWQRFEFKTQNKPNNFTPEGHNDLPTSGPRHPLKKKSWCSVLWSISTFVASTTASGFPAQGQAGGFGSVTY